MKGIIYSLITLCLFFSQNLLSQKCQNYEKKCPSPPKDFKVSSLSKSFSLQKKQTIRIKLTLYGERMYFFSVEGKKLLGDIHLRIYENNEERKILYDNAVNGFKKTKMLNVQSTINLIVEVSAPSYFKDRIRECSGFLVAFKNINE